MCKRLCSISATFKRKWPKLDLALKIILVTIDVVSFIVSISTLVYFSNRLAMTTENKFVLDYNTDVCYPLTGRTKELNTCNNNNGVSTKKWIMVWTDNKGRSVVENPFASRFTRAEAVSDRTDATLLSNRSCTCRKTIIGGGTDLTDYNCQVWETCIFNVEFIKYIQYGNTRYYTTNVSFIAGSSIAIFISLVSIPMAIVTLIRSRVVDQGKIETTRLITVANSNDVL